MSSSIRASMSVHADRSAGRYKALWNWFGYDEPNYTYSTHGRKLLAELSELAPHPPHIRTHNLLTSGDGVAALKWGSTNAYTEDADGRPVYDWTILDRIFDTYAETGTQPLIQIGFMPEALSTHDGPYRHQWSPTDRYSTITTGWAAPPSDLGKWADLVEAWARHLSERYGEDVVSQWPWEVWNEPDGVYWLGSIEEFCAMYDASARAVKRALPQARVGGPHTCGAFENPPAQKFLRTFLKHVVDHNSPIDFVAFHAKGDPVVHDGHVRMGIRKHLNDIKANLAILAEFPQLAHLPVIIGESDPEGCAACSARVHPQNDYRNGPLYGAYVVESMIRSYELSKRAGIEIEGAVTWAFMFDDQPYFDGFRDLATNGIDKAVLNAFRMLGKLGGDWVESASSHHRDIADILEQGVQAEPDIDIAATRDDRGVSILLWHYHDDDSEGPVAEVDLTIDGLGDRPVSLHHFRMDHTHSNAHGVWQGMGSPQSPEGADYDRLEASGKLAEIETQAALATTNGRLKLNVSIPRQGVSLLRIES